MTRCAAPAGQKATADAASGQTRVIDGYDDVRMILRHPVSDRIPVSRNLRRLLAATGQPHELLLRLADMAPLLSNGQDHVDKRRRTLQIVARFTRRWPEGRIQRLCEDRLGQLAWADGFDLHRDLSEHLLVTMTAESLGLPAEDVRRIIAPVSILVESILRTDMRLADFTALAAMVEGLAPLIDRAKIEPVETLDHTGSVLLSAQVLVPAIVLPGTVLTFAVLHLIRHPDLARRLRQDRSLLANFVHEALRHRAPAAFTVPAKAPCSFRLSDGGVLGEGDSFVCSIAGAGRDPRRFANPDLLDVSRPLRSELNLGTGPHRCPGAAISVTILETALRAVLGTCGLCLAGEVASHVGPLGARYDAVPVRFSPRPCSTSPKG